MGRTDSGAVGLVDVEHMTQHPDFGGWGYLGHECRTADTDQALVEAANRLGLDADEVFRWANSRFGRHFMDGAGRPTVEQLVAELRARVPVLR